MSNNVCTLVSKLSIVSFNLKNVSAIYCDGSILLLLDVDEILFLSWTDWRGNIYDWWDCILFLFY